MQNHMITKYKFNIFILKIINFNNIYTYIFNDMDYFIQDDLLYGRDL